MCMFLFYVSILFLYKLQCYILVISEIGKSEMKDAAMSYGTCMVCVRQALPALPFNSVRLRQKPHSTAFICKTMFTDDLCSQSQLHLDLS